MHSRILGATARSRTHRLTRRCCLRSTLKHYSTKITINSNLYFVTNSRYQVELSIKSSFFLYMLFLLFFSWWKIKKLHVERTGDTPHPIHRYCNTLALSCTIHSIYYNTARANNWSRICNIFMRYTESMNEVLCTHDIVVAALSMGHRRERRGAQFIRVNIPRCSFPFRCPADWKFAACEDHSNLLVQVKASRAG